MAKKVKKAKKTKKATVRRARVAVDPNNGIIPAALVLAADGNEDRFPSSDRVHDILHRRIDGRDVWKIVPRGGNWDNG
jgi:hypothetical protein